MRSNGLQALQRCQV